MRKFEVLVAINHIQTLMCIILMENNGDEAINTCASSSQFNHNS